MKPQLYSYIIADLIQRNSKSIIKDLKKRGDYAPWAERAYNASRLEKRDCDLLWNEKYDANVNNDPVWRWFITQELKYLDIYALLICWALTLISEGLLIIKRDDFLESIDELKGHMEKDIEEDKPIGKITAARYEDMRVNYLPVLHGMYEGKEWLN